jgi:hypothetical protein
MSGKQSSEAKNMDAVLAATKSLLQANKDFETRMSLIETTLGKMTQLCEEVVSMKRGFAEVAAVIFE